MKRFEYFQMISFLIILQKSSSIEITVSTADSESTPANSDFIKSIQVGNAIYIEIKIMEYLPDSQSFID
jgi:hypothetical protein